jgi:hypothetical protein
MTITMAGRPVAQLGSRPSAVSGQGQQPAAQWGGLPLMRTSALRAPVGRAPRPSGRRRGPGSELGANPAGCAAPLRTCLTNWHVAMLPAHERQLAALAIGPVRLAALQTGLRKRLQLLGRHNPRPAGAVVAAADASGVDALAEGIASLLTREGVPAIDDLLARLDKGNSANFYRVDTPEDLQAIYDKLSRGGEPATPATYDGKMVKLPDGTTVGLRNDSTSGGPTVDIKQPDGTNVKIHLP